MALGYMRRHRRWLYVFLWVVILGFIVFYIPAFQGSDEGAPGEAIGFVGGVPIGVAEFQRAYIQRRQMYEQLYQGRMDAAMLRSLGLEEQVFEGLVAEKLLVLEAGRLGIVVTDAELARSLTTAPDLQQDGKFMGAEELRRRLNLQGMSLADFEASRRTRLLAQKVESLVAGGVSVSPSEVERAYRQRVEQVKVEYVRVDSARYTGEVGVSDAEIAARFESKKETYRIPEKRTVRFALLDGELLRSQVTVTDADVEAAYQQRRDEFRVPEQVCASHILVKVKEGDAGEGHADAEARRLAEGILARLKAGADFAELARKESEDKGSAAGGGDLGCFERGRMLVEFDNAAFGLEKGQTSELVRTSAGYHIIRQSDRKDETVRPLSEVKEALRQRLLAQRVRTLAEEKAGRLAAALRKGRSLEEAAKGEGLGVQASPPFARGESVEPVASPLLVSRAFSIEKGKPEPDAYGVPRGAVFFELAEVQPSRLPVLKDVEARIRAELAAEKALERARAVALDLRARAERLGLEKAAAALGLLRKETPAAVGRGQALGDLGTGAALEAAAFGIPEKTLSDPVRVTGGYAILRVLERNAFDPVAFEKERARVAATLRQEKRGQFFQAYLNEARDRFRVERRPEVFQRVVG
jgi:peptidyl-prolyl cis-trans isomerase D